jgi:hypothetical protein
LQSRIEQRENKIDSLKTIILGRLVFSCLSIYFFSKLLRQTMKVNTTLVVFFKGLKIHISAEEEA